MGKWEIRSGSNMAGATVTATGVASAEGALSDKSPRALAIYSVVAGSALPARGVLSRDAMLTK